MLSSIARASCSAFKRPQIRRFHPLAGRWDGVSKSQISNNLVPMVIEQTVRIFFYLHAEYTI